MLKKNIEQSCVDDKEIEELYTSEMEVVSSCTYCGKYGHKGKHCWLWQTTAELLLSNLMSFADSKKLLLLDSISITDSGSITHSSGFSLCDRDNIINASKDSITTDTRGNNMVVIQIFNLK